GGFAVRGFDLQCFFPYFLRCFCFSEFVGAVIKIVVRAGVGAGLGELPAILLYRCSVPAVFAGLGAVGNG
ncbi:MAG TPA: hypothetical protein DDX91_06810, partial [Ruminococcaceae bacterium]|nr:hypothetical protein [Oscillospiraceae bacterium]